MRHRGRHLPELHGNGWFVSEQDMHGRSAMQFGLVYRLLP
jgi:hypothetical protein